MNFLAHLYLSQGEEDIMVGNFIADWVKGQAYQNFRPKIQQGIMLHRKIDRLTDIHSTTKELSKLFKSKYDKYSGVVIDILYDHTLCQNWKLFSDDNIIRFINDSYKALLKNFNVLPKKVQNFLPYMIAKNRLLSYSKIEGIKKALERMAQYTSLPDASDFAIDTYTNNAKYFNKMFVPFFRDLIEETNQAYKEITIKHPVESIIY